MEKNTRRKIKVLCLDNGGEYTSDHFLQLCREEGIERHFTVRTPQQNGVIERMNRTFQRRSGACRYYANISKSFQAEALACTCYLINRLPSFAIGGKAPLEAWSEKVAQNYDSLQVFLCSAYYHIKEDRLGLRARKDVFVGFKKDIKGYKIQDRRKKVYLEQRCHV